MKQREQEAYKAPTQRTREETGGVKVYEEYDPQSKTWRETGRAEPEQYGGLSKDKAGIVGDVNKEARADPRIRQYNAVQPQVAAAREGLAKENAATDRTIVTTFSKLLDPSTGVLQGEAAAAAGAETMRGLIQQAKGFIDKGQTIPPELRKEIVAGIERLNEGIRANYDAAIREYGDQLESLGVPRTYLHVIDAPAPRTVSTPGGAPAQPRSKTASRQERWKGNRYDEEAEE